MRNTLILIGQIHSNQADGLDPYHAIIEATVQRSRPVILTALAAVLAFIPLTHSVFWGSMAYVLIGGTAVGTVLTLAFLPALYAIWFRVSYVDAVQAQEYTAKIDTDEQRWIEFEGGQKKYVIGTPEVITKDSGRGACGSVRPAELYPL